MTLLIDALNKADKERRENKEKQTLAFVDEVDKEIQPTQQTAVNPSPAAITNQLNSTNNINPPPPAANQANSSQPQIPHPPLYYQRVNKKSGGFKYSVIFAAAIVLLVAGVVLFWHSKAPSGLVVNLPQSQITKPHLAEPTNEQPAKENLANLSPQNSINSLPEINEDFQNKDLPTAQNNFESLNNQQNLAKAQIDNTSNNVTQVDEFTRAKIEKVGARTTTNPPINRATAPVTKQRTTTTRVRNKVQTTNTKIINQQNNQITSSATKNLSRISTNQLLNDGASYMQSRDFSLAKNIYTEVIKRSPNNIEALQNLAAIAYNFGDNETAKQYFQKILNLNPHNIFASDMLNAIKSINGEIVKSTNLENSSAQSDFIRGTLNAEKGNWSLAQANFANALARDNRHPDYAYNLAVACDNLANYNCALQYYQLALINNRQGRGNFSTAIVRERIADIVNAISP